MTMTRLSLLFLVLCILLTACGDSSRASGTSTIAAAQPTKIIPPTQISEGVPIPTPTPVATLTPSPSQDDNDIREALLRYRFAEANNSSFPTSSFYCLGFETTSRSPSNLQDPPQALLDRFAGNNPPVVKASECVFDQQQHRVIEKTSGEPAVLWGLGSVTRTSPTKVDLELSYLHVFNGTGGSVFQLEWQNGSWQVVGYSVIWTA